MKTKGSRRPRLPFCDITNGESKAAIRGGRWVYGTPIVSSSPRWLDTVAGLRVDFVFIDTEHIALDRAQLSWMCQ